MMHIKNILMLLDATVNVYLGRKLLHDEMSLDTIDRCAKDILEYVEQKRGMTAHDQRSERENVVVVLYLPTFGKTTILDCNPTQKRVTFWVEP